jgi:ATP-dependent DNA helicase RecG
MERLVQGDVGSGKTVVAALSIAMVTHNGAQAALMAPTSILAEQHYRSLTQQLTKPAENGQAAMQPAQIRLLIGDTPEHEKEEIRAGLADGSIQLVIGTHALIEAPISFQRLQLAVIDEQHRFGVAQRSALRSKGENLHLLVMTATPIPRSLALTVYGDLDLSVMDEMPPGRQPIETFVLRPLERERAYTLIKSQLNAGNQAFIIYPLVEQGENGDSLAAVEEHRRLQDTIFPKLKLGLLHGRLKPEEKEDVMRRFRDREYHILVSTSVIEVGVDVPNASVMLVEGANRFGLAQLHQFRGRVGRGSTLSTCLLIPDKEDAVENERLLVMAETNDGFELAEHDLQQRGPGDFLGTRQAGFSELKMATLTDVRLIEKAREQAQLLFQDDPDLSDPAHQLLASKLDQFWGGGRGDIS